MEGKRSFSRSDTTAPAFPIKASADKIAKEIKLFGQEFKRYRW